MWCCFIGRLLPEVLSAVLARSESPADDRRGHRPPLPRRRPSQYRQSVLGYGWRWECRAVSAKEEEEIRKPTDHFSLWKLLSGFWCLLDHAEASAPAAGMESVRARR